MAVLRSLVVCASASFLASFVGAAGHDETASPHDLMLRRLDSSKQQDSSDQDDEVPDECQTCHDRLGAEVCDALRGSDFDRVGDLVPDFMTVCSAEACERVVTRRCLPDLDTETCAQCAVDFSARGGCAAMSRVVASGAAATDQMTSDLMDMVPPGCFACGDEAAHYCMVGGHPSTAVPSEEERCDACRDYLEDADVCKDLHERSEFEVFADLPAAAGLVCGRVHPLCVEGFVQGCFGGDDQPSCHTVSSRDHCYTHVMWAMEVGIQAMPHWYEGLSAESDFEDFQMHLHNGGHHSCPMPCPPAKPSCHNAVAGEECYEHVRWAMEVGIRALPHWYAGSGLSVESPIQNFQAWLHHIHHGDCPVPCF